jgi:predicted nucleic acid-binding protein
MTAVLDVSAAIEILMKKEKADLFGKIYQDASWIIAPELFIAEVSNVLWKYEKANIIAHEACIQYTEAGISLVDDYCDLKELWKEAQGEGIKNSHSVYDMYYAILARRNDAVLLTNDKQLAALCKKLKIQVCI